MKMTTLLLPLLIVSTFGTIGFSFLGGSALVWVLLSWVGLVPAVVLYVSTQSRTTLRAERNVENT